VNGARSDPQNWTVELTIDEGGAPVVGSAEAPVPTVASCTTVVPGAVNAAEKHPTTLLNVDGLTVDDT
jgi:hypothetical protein